MANIAAYYVSSVKQDSPETMISQIPLKSY